MPDANAVLGLAHLVCTILAHLVCTIHNDAVFDELIRPGLRVGYEAALTGQSKKKNKKEQFK